MEIHLRSDERFGLGLGNRNERGTITVNKSWITPRREWHAGSQVGSATILSAFKIWLCHLQTTGFGASHLTSASSSVKWGYYENQTRILHDA